MNTSQRGLFRSFVLIISFVLCIQATRTIVELWHRRDIVRARQAELEAKNRKNAHLEGKLAETKRDDYVEKIARDTLGLVKDGEAILILPKSQATNHNDQINEQPNWKKWWKLFF